MDGVTAEHLVFGNSHILRAHLSALLTFIFTNTIIPTVLQEGVIVPILKKPGLNPNEPSSYQPITVCSIYTKLTKLDSGPRQGH